VAREGAPVAAVERIPRSALDLIEAMDLLRDGGAPNGLCPADCAWRGFLRPPYLPDGFRVTTELAGPSGRGLAFTVTAFDEEDWEVGAALIDMPVASSHDDLSSCSTDMLNVAYELGLREPLSWLVLHHSHVESDYRGLGLGAAMYREAIRVAWQCFGALLVADACAGGTTSSYARRVWASRRFRDDPYLAVSGLVAGWRGD
jgi:GNAT superfamily N-acetyltransferase